METKLWYQSKSLWLGVILTLAGIVPLVAELLNGEAVTPQGIVLLFGGVLAVVLRVWFTDTQIEH